MYYFQYGFAGSKTLVFLMAAIVITGGVIVVSRQPNFNFHNIFYSKQQALKGEARQQAAYAKDNGGLEQNTLVETPKQETTTQGLAASTSEVPKQEVILQSAEKISPDYISQLITEEFNLLLAQGKLGTSSTSTSNGLFPNSTGQSTLMVGGIPLVTYVLPVPSQNFTGTSIAGFGQLSSDNLSVGKTATLNSLSVTANTNLSGSLTVAGQTTFATASMDNLTVSGNVGIGTSSPDVKLLVYGNARFGNFVPQWMMDDPFDDGDGGHDTNVIISSESTRTDNHVHDAHTGLLQSLEIKPAGNITTTPDYSGIWSNTSFIGPREGHGTITDIYSKVYVYGDQTGPANYGGTGAYGYATGISSGPVVGNANVDRLVSFYAEPNVYDGAWPTTVKTLANYYSNYWQWGANVDKFYDYYVGGATEWADDFTTSSAVIGEMYGIYITPHIQGANKSFNLYSAGVSSINYLEGKIGIASTSPSAQLTIQGTSTAPAVPLLTIASSSGATYLTVKANGNVGIGTTSPIGLLSVSSSGNGYNIYSAGTSTKNLFDGKVYIGNNAIEGLVNRQGLQDYGGTRTEFFGVNNIVTTPYTDAHDNAKNLVNFLNWIPSADVSTTPDVYGLFQGASLQGPPERTVYGGSVTGSETYATLSGGVKFPHGTITANTAWAEIYEGGSSVDKMFGTDSWADTYYTGTVVNEMIGARGGAYSEAGTIGIARGLAASSDLYGGTVGTSTALYVFSDIDGATVGNAYGIYINPHISGATNNYNFFSEGATSKNIFQGSVGIGTTSPAQKLHIGSAASGGNVQIANGWLCVDTNDSCTGANTAGRIYANNGTVVGGVDVAESYPTTDLTLEAGNVVAVDGSNPVHVVKASSTSTALGIISTKPGVLLGGFGEEQFQNSTTVPVALVGRVPVKFSDENGTVKPGDYLTISKTQSGFAAKAISEGFVLGLALTEPENGTVIAFLGRTYYSPKVADMLQNGIAEESSAWLNGLANINMADASVFGNIAVTGSVAVQKDLRVGGIIYAVELKVDTVTAKKLCLDDICITKDDLRRLLDLSAQPGQPAEALVPDQTEAAGSVARLPEMEESGIASSTDQVEIQLGLPESEQAALQE